MNRQDTKNTKSVKPQLCTATQPKRGSVCSTAKRKLIFEPDLEQPQTIESLAAQQRTFLAANEQEWVDVELPSRC